MSDSDSIKNPILDKFYRIPIRLNESDLEISDTESVISKSVKTDDASDTVYLTYKITEPEGGDGVAGSGPVLSIVMYHFDGKKPTEDSKEYITGNEDVIKKFKNILDKEENLKKNFKKIFGDLFDIGEKEIELIKDDDSINELSGKITETTSLKELDEYLNELKDDDVKSVATDEVNEMLDELLKDPAAGPAAADGEGSTKTEEGGEQEAPAAAPADGEGSTKTEEGGEQEAPADGEGTTKTEEGGEQEAPAAAPADGEGGEPEGGETEVTLDMDAFNTNGLKGVKMYSVNDDGETEITKLKVVGEIAQMGGKSRKMKKMKKMQSKKKRPKQTKRGGKKAVKQSRKKK